jgi:hypothetical protein
MSGAKSFLVTAAAVVVGMYAYAMISKYTSKTA